MCSTESRGHKVADLANIDGVVVLGKFFILHVFQGKREEMPCSGRNLSDYRPWESTLR